MSSKCTWLMRDGKLLEITEHLANYKPKPRVYVHTDIMPTRLFHPADGGHYDSKSKFRKITKAHGCTEIGTTPPEQTVSQRADVHADIEQDVAEAFNSLT